MNQLFGLLLCTLNLLLHSGDATCGSACLAYEWGYPLWHSANLRYLQAANGLTFSMNTIATRRGSLLNSNMVLCSSSICGGTPSDLNPAPVVSPNVDTIYGAAQLDIQQAFKLTVPNPGGRWFSAQFLDEYTNSIAYIDSVTYPSGGTFCIVSPVATDNCGTVTASFTIRQYGQVIFRTYSNGSQTTGTGACGVDGCTFLKGVTFAVANSPTKTVGDPKADYGQYMNSSSSVTCQYLYNQTICGNSATAAQRNAFWNGLCKAITLNPLTAGTAEANYVTANFASLGIHYNGCGTLNYTALNTALDPTTTTSGWSNVQNGLNSSFYVFGPWIYLNYTGNWSTDYYTRVQTSTRLHAMNSNVQAVYYTAFKDSSNLTLNANGASYKIDFSQAIPINVTRHGFWSVTLYDNTFYLFSNSANVYAIRGNTSVIPAEIHVAPTCTTTNCIPAPKSPFNLMFRVYAPQASIIQPGGTYVLPTITKCATATTCD